MPVTPHTLFWTGSTTKSFTAAGLSLLIDNSSEYSGVRWETPISQLLREDFVLSDDWATEVKFCSWHLSHVGHAEYQSSTSPSKTPSATAQAILATTSLSAIPPSEPCASSAISPCPPSRAPSSSTTI